ncbi:hypothetical protein ABPG74_017772 [Tetrahymena malaccensis]
MSVIREREFTFSNNHQNTYHPQDYNQNLKQNLQEKCIIHNNFNEECELELNSNFFSQKIKIIDEMLQMRQQKIHQCLNNQAETFKENKEDLNTTMKKVQLEQRNPDFDKTINLKQVFISQDRSNQKYFKSKSPHRVDNDRFKQLKTEVIVNNSRIAKSQDINNRSIKDSMENILNFQDKQEFQAFQKYFGQIDRWIKPKLEKLQQLRWEIEQIYSFIFKKEIKMNCTNNLLKDNQSFSDYVNEFLKYFNETRTLVSIKEYHQKALNLLYSVQFYRQKYEDIKIFSGFLAQSYSKQDLVYFLQFRCIIEYVAGKFIVEDSQFAKKAQAFEINIGISKSKECIKMIFGNKINGRQQHLQENLLINIKQFIQNKHIQNMGASQVISHIELLSIIFQSYLLDKQLMSQQSYDSTPNSKNGFCQLNQTFTQMTTQYLQNSSTIQQKIDNNVQSIQQDEKNNSIREQNLQYSNVDSNQDQFQQIKYEQLFNWEYDSNKLKVMYNQFNNLQKQLFDQSISVFQEIAQLIKIKVDQNQLNMNQIVFAIAKIILFLECNDSQEKQFDSSELEQLCQKYKFYKDKYCLDSNNFTNDPENQIVNQIVRSIFRQKELAQKIVALEEKNN